MEVILILQDLITGIQHVGIPTRDIDQTIAFYRRLGFEIAFRSGEKSKGNQVAFLRQKNLTLEIYDTCDKIRAIDHFALDVIDIEKTFELIKADGEETLNSKVEFLPFWKNGVKFFSIEGPNAENIEFSQILP